MLRKVVSIYPVHQITTAETWQAYQETVAKLRSLEKQIATDFWKSPTGDLIRGLAHSGSVPGGKFEERLGGPSYVVQHYADLTELQPLNQTIESSVLNQLLNSKLLTDEEKRSLLQEQGILKPKEVMRSQVS